MDLLALSKYHISNHLTGVKGQGTGHQWCEGTNTRWVFLGAHYSVYLLSFCLHCHSILIATNFDCYDSVKVASNGGNPLLHQITLDFLPQGTQSTMPLKWLCVWQFSNCGPVDKFGHLYFCFLQLFEEIVAYIFNTRHWLPRNLPPAVSAAIVKPFKAIKPRAAWNSYCLTQAKNLNVKKFCEGLMWSLF